MLRGPAELLARAGHARIRKRRASSAFLTRPRKAETWSVNGNNQLPNRPNSKSFYLRFTIGWLLNDKFDMP